MASTNEADVLDVVRRLRTTVNNLDNANLLSERINALGDPLLSAMIEKVVGKIQAASSATAALLKHVENNRTYKGIVKRYRAPDGSTPIAEIEGIEEEEIDHGGIP